MSTDQKQPIRVTVWHEYLHEKFNEKVRELYPEGMHTAIAGFLCDDPLMKVRTSTLQDPDCGLDEHTLEQTDVLTIWGHHGHADVDDAAVDRVCRRVNAGMGLIVLHSGHHAKIFQRLMGTSCDLRWRMDNDRERLWNVAPNHPITQGIGEYFELPHHEMYGELFDIPAPDELIFISWFSGGEVFRSGCTWRRGHGKVFYFSPGHETCPIFYNNNVQRVIKNAIHWAAPLGYPEHVPFSASVAPESLL